MRLSCAIIRMKWSMSHNIQGSGGSSGVSKVSGN